ncbi:MAG: hypothetical protein NT034_02410 [Candidatus Magasanikbacteria bacterium]|nr:hypothetical protein [Candidatus Magasanikbacteria bacterium]
MAWYKKQLAEKLKELEAKKPKSKSKAKKDDAKKPNHPAFDPRKISGHKINPSPVAARNINRPKTDKP